MLKHYSYRTFLIILFFSILNSVHSQCSIPYGKKTFSIAEYYSTVYNSNTKKNEKKIIKTTNTTLNLEVAKNTVSSNGDFFVVSGAFISGRSAEYIVEWSCNEQKTQKVFKITTNDSKQLNYWVLSVDNNGSIIKLAMIMGNGSSDIILFQ